MTKDPGTVKLLDDQAKRFSASSPKRLRALEIDAERATEAMQAACETAREQFYYALIREIVETQYDIGELVDVFQIFGGYVNMTFGICTLKDGERHTWLFRKYREGKAISSLNFEHRLLLHAKANGFSFGAAPIATRDGRTCHSEMVDTGKGEAEFLFGIFNYIEGEKLYGWMNNWAEEGLAEATIASGARNLAELHSSTIDFDPQGQHGDNLLLNDEGLPMNALIAKYPETLAGYRKTYAERELSNVFTKYLDATSDYVANLCARATVPESDYVNMISCPCHCDVHGGNFIYSEDGTVIGSFDYDSAQVDSRLFDLALAIHYLFASWEPTSNGVLRLERAESFLRRYNSECVAIGKIGPLNATEKRYLYETFLQAPLYVHGWGTTDVVTFPDVDPYEYLYYSQHFIQALQWLEAHEQEIRDLAGRL